MDLGRHLVMCLCDMLKELLIFEKPNLLLFYMPLTTDFSLIITGQVISMNRYLHTIV